MTDLEKTPRSRVKRVAKRGVHDRETVNAILDAGLLCHVGYIIDGSPYVTPTCYWRKDDHVYWHGSAASRMIETVAGGVPVCFTASHLDGLVMARSGFHHSVNYRSVMLFGEAQLITEPAEKLAALADFMETFAPGRWDDVRATTDQELKATKVVTMEIKEGAAKVRNGGPVDDEPDYDLDIWAGVIPVTTVLGAPVPDARQKPGVTLPDYLKTVALGRAPRA